AIEIVQIMDTRHTACNGIEQFGRHRLTKRVVTLLLPARNKVKPTLGDALVQLGDLVGTILQVSIHGNPHITLRSGKPDIKGSGLTVIASEFDGGNLRVHGFKSLDNHPGVVRTTIVDHNDFVAEPMAVHDPTDPRSKLGQ